MYDMAFQITNNSTLLFAIRSCWSTKKTTLRLSRLIVGGSDQRIPPAKSQYCVKRFPTMTSTCLQKRPGQVYGQDHWRCQETRNQLLRSSARLRTIILYHWEASSMFGWLETSSRWYIDVCIKDCRDENHTTKTNGDFVARSKYRRQG